MTQTLLPFILKGVSEVIDTSEKKSRTSTPTKSIPNSTLDSMYNVPEKYFNKEELARHKRTLTMIPIDTSFSNQSPVQFDAFESKNGILSVPRFYGIEHFGKPENDETKLGVEMQTSHFTGKLNTVQEDACSQILERLDSAIKGGLVVLPCGYGKTVCALYIAAQKKRRTLVLVHKAFLVEQWQERAETFIPGCTVGKIQQNIIKHDADIVIGMVQSFSKRTYPAEIMSNFGMLIIDESHHMAAPVLHRALRQIPSRYIVSLSATPDRRDGLTRLLYWSMGSICYKIDRKPEHTLVSCMIYEGGTRKEIQYRDGRISMPLMLNALVEDDARNTLISDRVAACYHSERYTIILTDRIKQLHIIFVKLSKQGIPAKDMGYYIGTTSAADRAISSECRIILSTYSMAKEGLDIPRLDTLVLATPKGDIVQAGGRVQRKHAEKKVPLIIDVVDTYSVFEQLRWKRWKFYKKEGFNCQSYETNNENTPWFT
tara:strand:+ start:7717 stop:9174 length:1458 start_codon:yes stop_codon:yes gene_type:complete